MGHRPHNYVMTPSTFNIILFGETGVGKSSIINLIAGKKVAETSSDTGGCTLESKQYTFPVADRTFHIWDTVGLGEPFLSETHCLGAIEKAYKLIRQIEALGGLDLLLFCIPGSSGVTQTMQSNYLLFYEVLCEKRIPISAVVTHLEDEERMEEWWGRNEKHIRRRDLKFSGHACVTGLPGHPKATESQESLRRLLLNHDPQGYYAMPPSRHILDFFTRLRATPSPRKEKDKQCQLERQLRARCQMNDDNARQLAETLARHTYNPSSPTQHESPAEPRPSFNIMLFGEAGVGKSSVINLIAESNVADTSRNAWGCTLESRMYAFEVATRRFNIWDTVGLGEPNFSVSNCFGAIEKTYALIKQIKAEGGLDLLLFCIPGSGSRMTQTMLYNYRLFFDVLCEGRIPIAVVVTRLEDEEKMEDWWVRNGEYISQGGLRFGGHACITGQRGHPNAAKGRSDLESLLLSYDHKGRYPMPPAADWFSGFLERLPNIPRSKKLKEKQKDLERLLRKRCMMDSVEARRLAEALTRSSGQAC